jgi:hypothetical protein
MFELTRPTTVLLGSVTNRGELHGEDKVPAVSLGLTIVTSAAILDSLCPEVRALLRAPGVDAVSLKTICQGWTVLVDHGIDVDEPIKLCGCKIDKFKVSPKDDDAVELRLRVASSDLTPLRLGLLGMKVQQEIVVKMTAPKGATQTSDDDTIKAMKKQHEQEAAGQERLDAGEQDTPLKALTRGVKAKAKRQLAA